MQKIFYVIFSLFVFFVGLGFIARSAEAACGVTDAIVHTPGAITVPAKGQSYTDPLTGCTIRRVSDVATEGGGAISHLYSSVNPFNANSTFLLVGRKDGVMQVRDLYGKIIQNDLSTSGILPLSDAAWSRTDPNIIYFHPVDGNTLRRYNVKTNTVETLDTFTDYAKVTFGFGEGDISWDGDHLAVVGDDRWGFIYTISSKTATKRVDLVAAGNGVSLNNIDVTPGNQFYVMYNPQAKKGLDLYDPSMNFTRALTDFESHADRSRDLDGTDVVVVTNSADTSPMPDCPNGIVKIRGENGVETCLQPLDWSLVVHISCNNVGQGWCIVSTYAGTGTAWKPYRNEIFKVSFDGSTAVRLAHTRSSNASYDAEPRAAVSGDGKYVVFASDMSGAIDTYIMTLDDSPTPTSGELLKLACAPNAHADDPCKAVYYAGADGMRHAFPNERTYFTWYPDFSQVKTISQTALSALPLSKNVVYRPGVKMVKFVTDPKVYAVAKNGVLRWISTAQLASAYYGLSWNTKIDDLSDALFPDYHFGTDIRLVGDYNPTGEMDRATTIDQNL